MRLTHDPPHVPGGAENGEAASSPARVALPRITDCVLASPTPALASHPREVPG